MEVRPILDGGDAPRCGEGMLSGSYSSVGNMVIGLSVCAKWDDEIYCHVEPETVCGMFQVSSCDYEVLACGAHHDQYGARPCLFKKKIFPPFRF